MLMPFIDRLETVSLSQALAPAIPRISTGLADLDNALDGGFVRGQIMEIYGCPGSGKTTFGCHMAARVLTQSLHVCWLECSQILPASRLRDVLQAVRGDDDDDDSDADAGHNEDACDAWLRRVQCVYTPTLTSLLSLLHGDGDICHADTALLVVDDLTTLFNAAFPPDMHQKDTSVKKSRVLEMLADSLARLAVTKNIAVIVLSKLTSKIHKGGPAQLESPFGAPWSTLCNTRMVLYRDTYHRRLSQSDDEEVRWAAVQKVGNRNVHEPKGLPIKIIGSGIVAVDLEASQLAFSMSRSQSSKAQIRNHEEAFGGGGTDSPLPPVRSSSLTMLSTSSSPPPASSSQASDLAVSKKQKLCMERTER